MRNYSFRFEPTDCFCYAFAKQNYCSGELDPGTSHATVKMELFATILNG